MAECILVFELFLYGNTRVCLWSYDHFPQPKSRKQLAIWCNILCI